MKKSERRYRKIDMVAKATISELKQLSKNSEGACITKSKLIPRIVKRIERDLGLTIDDENYSWLIEEDGMSIPDEAYVWGNWSDVCKHCAKKYIFYVVFEPRVGVRSGDIKDYKNNQKTIVEIAQGAIDSANDRGEILRNRGEQSAAFAINVKQLEAITEPGG